MIDYARIYNLLITTIAVLFVLVTHEFAHAYVAYLQGDNTAKNLGRLTLNPIKHLDPIGTISMIIFGFGWARPVPINPLNFNKKRWGMFTVSIAGIAINLITAFIAIALMLYAPLPAFLGQLSHAIAFYGVVFALFNFIPIPPLDGSKILGSFLPESFNRLMYKYQRYTYILLIVLLAGGLLDKVLNPAVIYVFNSIINILI